MRQSSSWYFEVLFHRGTSHDRLIEKFFCLSIPSLEFLILSTGILVIVSPCWHSMVGGDTDDEPLYMATWLPHCVQHYKILDSIFIKS